MPQDYPDYSQFEADQIAAEGDKWLLEKQHHEIAMHSKALLPCTCAGSTSGLDIDLCPRHGVLM